MSLLGWEWASLCHPQRFLIKEPFPSTCCCCAPALSLQLCYILSRLWAEGQVNRSLTPSSKYNRWIFLKFYIQISLYFISKNSWRCSRERTLNGFVPIHVFKHTFECTPVDHFLSCLQPRADRNLSCHCSELMEWYSCVPRMPLSFSATLVLPYPLAGSVSEPFSKTMLQIIIKKTDTKQGRMSFRKWLGDSLRQLYQITRRICSEQNWLHTLRKRRFPEILGAGFICWRWHSLVLFAAKCPVSSPASCSHCSS